VTCHADANTTYTAGLGLALAGTTFLAKGTPFGEVIVVAKSGGDFTSIQSALDSITDATATKPYLVYVAPGRYSEKVTMKAYVTIEGAGQGATIFHWTGGSSPSASATLTGADYAVMRDFNVESDGTGQNYGVAIYNSSASPTMTNVTATASNGNDANYGVYNGNSSPTMENVTVTVPGGGTGNYGVYNYSSSPTMDNVTTTASGGTYSYGVVNFLSSSPTMNNVTAKATGASTSSNGVYNYNSSSPTMTNVTATASGGSGENYGVYNYSSSPRIRNSILTGTTGSVYSDGGGDLAYSELVGPVTTGLTCIGNYDASLAAVTCP